MRVLVCCLIVFLSLNANAQVYPGGYLGQSFAGNMGRNFNYNDSLSPQKWSLNKYSSLSTSFSVWKGGSANVISAPMGLQLNRRLNNNLYAFAGVNVAPAYVNFRSNFMNANNSNKLNQGNSFMNRQGSFGVFSRAELGLMYTNDERTFQISGSFGIERSQFPSIRDFQPLNTNNNRQPIIR